MVKETDKVTASPGEGNANRMVTDFKRAKHCKIYSPVVVAVVVFRRRPTITTNDLMDEPVEPEWSKQVACRCKLHTIIIDDKFQGLLRIVSMRSLCEFEGSRGCLCLQYADVKNTY